MSMLVDLYGRSATLPPVELNTGVSDGLVLFSWMFAMLIATSCVTRSWSSRGRTIVCEAPSLMNPDRKSVVEGKSVSVRVDLGGRRIIKKKTRHYPRIHSVTDICIVLLTHIQKSNKKLT